MNLKKLLIGVLSVVSITFSSAVTSTLLNYDYVRVNAETDETMTFSKLYGSDTALKDKTIEGTNWNVTFKKNSGQTEPKYYKKGTAARVYGGNLFIIKAAQGYKLSEIILTYGSGGDSNAITVNTGTFSGNTWTGGADEVTFTVGGTSGHRRLSSIAVTLIEDNKNLTKLNAPVVSIDPQTGVATWEAVENASGYIYTIGEDEQVVTNDLKASRPLKDGESIVVFAKGDNETYSDSDSVKLDYDAPANVKVKNLLNLYYFGGSYTRTTKINLDINDSEVLKEINNVFHAGSILLDRTTYFNGDSLWMTNEETDEKGTYSYYGTKYDGDTPVGVTGGRVPLNETTSNVVLSGEGKESMENYYTTMVDLLNNKANWVKDGNVFSTEDSNVIKMFLDFTAPCFLNYTKTNSNYFTLSKAQIEETANGLELRLITSGDEAKLIEDSNDVLSSAVITKFNPSSNDVLTEDAELSFNTVENRTTLSTTLQIWEQNGIVLTNSKENSTNDIVDYANPARFYKSTKVKIESTVGKFNQIIVKTDGGEYSNALVTSINAAYDDVATSNSTTVTVTLNESVSSIEFVLTGGQVRVRTLTLKNV